MSATIPRPRIELAQDSRFDAFSFREPVSTSLENALFVLEFVFFVDPSLVPKRRFAAAERSRHIGIARGVGVAPADPRRDFLARHRRRLADDAAAGTAHQADR